MAEEPVGASSTPAGTRRQLEDLLFAEGPVGPRQVLFRASEQVVDDGGQAVRPIGDRNSERYPSYARLHLRASRAMPLGSGTFRYFLEVTNLLNRNNIRSTSDIELYPAPRGSVEVEYHDETWTTQAPRNRRTGAP